MKYPMMLLAISLTISTFGQKPDTLMIDSETQRQWVIKTYYEDGSVRAMIYQSSKLQDDTTVIDGHLRSDMSAEDLFMRGVLATVKNPRSLRMTDSTHTFFHNGKVDRKTFFRDGFTYDYIYDQDWKLQYIEKTQRERKEYLFFHDQSLVVSDLSTRLIGRIGTTVSGKFTLSNQSDQPLSLTFTTSNDQLVLPERMTLAEGESRDLLPRWQMTAQEGEAVLKVSVANKGTFELQLSYEGYHLNEMDFLEDVAQVAEFDFREVSTLLIRLSSSEKLLKIENESSEKVVELSVPKILNSVYLDKLPAGEYILILVDLGSRQEKFCRIRI